MPRLPRFLTSVLRVSPGQARRFAPALFLVNLAVFWAVKASRGAEDAPLTIASYKRFIVEQRARLSELLVEYSSETTCDEASRKRGLLRGVTAEVHVTIARSGARRHSTSWQRGTLTDGSESRDELVSVYTGAENRERGSGALRIQIPKSAYSEMSTYLNSLLWPSSESELNECRERPLETHHLPYFLDEMDYRVESARETVKGVECVVIRKLDGGRTLWLDPARGHAILRFEFHRPWRGERRWQCDHDDLREVAPGIFLPLRIEETSEYDEPDTGAAIGSTSTMIQVQRISLGPLEESLFVLEPRAGESVFDSRNRAIYEHHPVDDNALERVLAAAELDGEAIVVEETKSWLLLVTVGGLIVAPLLFVIVRRARAVK